VAVAKAKDKKKKTNGAEDKPTAAAAKSFAALKIEGIYGAIPGPASY